jgi:hypothetical protein
VQQKEALVSKLVETNFDSLPEEVGINWDIERPIEKDYKNWDEYWIEFCNYMVEKYKNTNCRKK